MFKGAKHKSNTTSPVFKSVKHESNLSPDCEGLIVTRGGSRVEKLIKCDLCGNVYRTSNIARHKKRYCKAIFGSKVLYRSRFTEQGNSSSMQSGEVQEFGLNDSGCSQPYHVTLNSD